MTREKIISLKTLQRFKDNLENILVEKQDVMPEFYPTDFELSDTSLTLCLRQEDIQHIVDNAYPEVLFNIENELKLVFFKNLDAAYSSGNELIYENILCLGELNLVLVLIVHKGVDHGSSEAPEDPYLETSVLSLGGGVSPTPSYDRPYSYTLKGWDIYNSEYHMYLGDIIALSAVAPENFTRLSVIDGQSVVAIRNLDGTSTTNTTLVTLSINDFGEGPILVVHDHADSTTSYNYSFSEYRGSVECLNLETGEFSSWSFGE